MPAEMTKRFTGRLDLPAGNGHETAEGSGTASDTPRQPASPAAKAGSTTASQSEEHQHGQGRRDPEGLPPAPRPAGTAKAASTRASGTKASR